MGLIKCVISEKSVCDSLKFVSYLRVVIFGITFPVFSDVCEAFRSLGWVFLKRGQLKQKSVTLRLQII